MKAGKARATRSSRTRKESSMTNEEKLEAIRPWSDPEERVTVDFLD